MKSDATIYGKSIGVLDPEIGSRIVRPLRVSDLELRVRREQGEKYEKDVTCDSAFMARMMPDIGKWIREKYHFVPRSHPIYLIMDNAGEW